MTAEEIAGLRELAALRERFHAVSAERDKAKDTSVAIAMAANEEIARLRASLYAVLGWVEHARWCSDCVPALVDDVWVHEPDCGAWADMVRARAALAGAP